MKRIAILFMLFPAALAGCVDLASFTTGGSASRNETVKKGSLPAIDPKMPVDPTAETPDESPGVEETSPGNRSSLSQLPMPQSETRKSRPVTAEQVTPENAREMAARFAAELSHEEAR